ncbi:MULTISPECIES: DUF2199 domain-containing protein [Leptospira]|uniref:DUF2199 domain-containing protein n=1 Tax=Leptospira TaxID=171 RepID=UPI00108484AA|nr:MULTISPECIES: DUF2199 domain-containing protein [Leptospira]MCW7471707.1 DUF2199 domain-containing protein [Leptospira kanakyensis]TGL23133.1 DUF2199 domain-containing protein [Leptospira levettii]
MKFTCSCCNQTINEIPSFAWDKPLDAYDVPDENVDTDIFLNSDLCVINDKWFYVRGCIEIPIIDEDDFFIWGVWVSLSETNFFEFQSILDKEKRSHYGPYFGWLSADLKVYPDTHNLKTRLHIRDNGIRPYIEVEQNGHPLALEQANGITKQRLGEIYACIIHNKCPELPK